MRKCLAIAALLLCVGVAGAVQFIRMISPFAASEVAPFRFTLATNTTNTPPYIEAALLTNYGDVVWNSPTASTNTKTPPWTFFTNAGNYSLTVADWSKVTGLSFTQNTYRAFLTGLTADPVDILSGLKRFGMGYNTNIASITLTFPSCMTNLVGAFLRCYSMTSFPPVNHCTNITGYGLAATWKDCRAAQSFPPVSNLVELTSLAETWAGCIAATGFPYVNSLTKNRSLQSTWEAAYVCQRFPEVDQMVSNVSLHFTWYATRATSYPSVATMSNVTTYASTWRECYNLVDAPTIPTALPARVTSVQQTWQHCRKMLTVQDVSCFTNLGFGLAGGGFYGTWDNCWVVTNMPITNCSFAPLPSTLASLFANCSNMVGSIGAWTWRTNIASFDSYNSQIWYTNVPGCFAYNVKTNGFALRMDNSKMPADHVSQVLIDLDFVGATNGTVNVGGTTAGISNMPPNAAGYIAVTNLRAKGWTVTVN